MLAERAAAATATLIERDRGLADAARRTAAELGLRSAAVITGDAGDPALCASVGPVDLLLLCGIFGNVSESDIRTTIAATPMLLRDHGTVIWTRGSTRPDLRPAIRRWFIEAGLTEIAFDSEPTGFGVGVAVRSGDEVRDAPLPARLFCFRRSA